MKIRTITRKITLMTAGAVMIAALTACSTGQTESETTTVQETTTAETTTAETTTKETTTAETTTEETTTPITETTTEDYGQGNGDQWADDNNDYGDGWGNYDGGYEYNGNGDSGYDDDSGDAGNDTQVGNTSQDDGGKTVVSDVMNYDCDGSGHGVEVITYSDGSQEFIEF